MGKQGIYYPILKEPLEYDISGHSRYSHKEKEDKGELIYLGMGIDPDNRELKHFWKETKNG